MLILQHVMIRVLAFPYRSCVIVCEAKHNWSDLSFTGVCTLVS